MKSKKIVRVSTAPISLETLLKGQLRMLASEYEVVGVASPGDELELLSKREGIRVIAVPMERRIAIWKDVVSLWRLWRVFRKERPDMVHSITPKAGLLSMLAAKLAGVPVRIHTFTGLVFPTATGLMQKLLIWMDRLTCACATYINPEGEGVKRDLIMYKITKKPLHVIANGNVNGIDVDYFKPTKDLEYAVQKFTDKNIFTFVFVGRVVRNKGINELVLAFEKLYKENLTIRLIIVGPLEENLDPVLPEVKECMRTCSGIVLTGFQKDIRPFLMVANVLVLPSYREGFPNVVMQGGAMGLPCIVTDISGSNEIIIPNKNGIIIPSRDEEALYEAMRYAVEHPDEMRKMGKEARPLIVDRYEQHIVWEALLKEYQKLLRG